MYSIYHQRTGKTSFFHMRGVDITHFNACCTFNICTFNTQVFGNGEVLLAQSEPHPSCLIAVPSAPRGLMLQLAQDDPPVVKVTWQRPRATYGELVGFKLTYGRQGESPVQERRFDGEKYTFTTGFLGTLASGT